jgi:predicted RNase H-like HicB family nuclease
MPGLVAYNVLGYSNNVTLKVLIHSAEEGGYWAEVPALPGCVSQGETRDELRSNIREAIEGWLLAEDAAAESIAAVEVIEVAV